MRLTQLIVFILATVVNFGVQLFYPSPFDDDGQVYNEPAGYAFSIWGPIFLGMIIYSVFQMSSKRVESPHLRKATLAGILAGLASIAFVPLSYTGHQPIILINLVWHLGALIWLFVELSEQVKLETDRRARWFYLPSQLYLGWISAATAIGFALALEYVGLNLADSVQINLTAVIIAALATVAIFMVDRGGGVVALTVVWALIGIIVKYGEISTILYAAIAAILLILATVGLHLRRGGGIVWLPRS